MSEVVNFGVAALPNNLTDAQRVAYKKVAKKDYKALFLIHSCLIPIIFELFFMLLYQRKFGTICKRNMLEMRN